MNYKVNENISLPIKNRIFRKTALNLPGKQGAVHSDDFKHEAVRIALTSGLTRRQVASDLRIGFSTLSKWVQISRTDETISVPDQDLFEEVERLRKENLRLKEERDILKPALRREEKPATVFFAEQSK